MIRLITYNIRAARGMDNVRSVDRIADVIRASNAQIVCLQEVDQLMKRSGFVDQPRSLAEELGMSVTFQRNLPMDRGGFGNAIFTSFDLAQSISHSLTSRGEQRGVLEALIQTPDGPLTVFCTHLGLNRAERVTQAQEIAALMNAIPDPKLVCGDFNERIGDAAISELITSASLVDAAADGSATFDSEHPTERIDFVFRDPSITVRSAQVMDTQASDHLPLVVDLELPA